jgi:hypothetical protein
MMTILIRMTLRIKLGDISPEGDLLLFFELLVREDPESLSFPSEGRRL